jgi:CBS domain-containing protein
MSLERFTRKRVIVADLHESASEVARKMEREHVGAVIILRGALPAGIVTDRDLALRVVASTLLAAETPVEQVMSRDLVTIRIDDALDAAVERMRQCGVRRLPIVDQNGRLCGLVSLDDLHVLFAGEMKRTAEAIMENRGP